MYSDNDLVKQLQCMTKEDAIKPMQRAFFVFLNLIGIVSIIRTDGPWYLVRTFSNWCLLMMFSLCLLGMLASGSKNRSILAIHHMLF